MATNKTTVVAEIKIDGAGAAQTVGQLKDELNGIGKATSKAAEGSIAQLKELKKQLKLTAAGSEDFKKLYNQIDDLEDKIKSSKNVSKDWIDSLEGAGGPLGMVGAALNKAKVATTSFGAALKATGIGLIVALLSGLAAAFAKNEGQMKKLQPIFDSFGRILNGVLGAMQPLIDATIEFALKALPYVSKAFEVAYSSVSAFMQSLGIMASAVKKFISGDFSGAWDDAKKSVTSFGDNYEAANKRFKDGTSDLTDHEKEELKKREELRKAAAEKQKQLNDDKIAEEQRVQNELLKAELDAIEKRKKALAKISTEIIGPDGLTKTQREANAKEALDRKADFLKQNQDLIDQSNETGFGKFLTDKAKNVSTSLTMDIEASDASKRIAKENAENRILALQEIGEAMINLGSIVGEQTAAGKALGIASALINTYVGATQVLKSESVLPEPLATISKVINVGAIIATGMKSIKAITSVQVPGGKGGGGASIPSSSFGVAAPLSPTASVTNFNQEQINQIGNKASRAYVVESDITGNQERIERLNRAARIG